MTPEGHTFQVSRSLRWLGRIRFIVENERFTVDSCRLEVTPVSGRHPNKTGNTADGLIAYRLKLPDSTVEWNRQPFRHVVLSAEISGLVGGAISSILLPCLLQTRQMCAQFFLKSADSSMVESMPWTSVVPIEITVHTRVSVVQRVPGWGISHQGTRSDRTFLWGVKTLCIGGRGR